MKDMCPKNIIKLRHSKGGIALNEVLSKWKMLFCGKFPLEFSSTLNSLPFRMLIGTEKHATHMARSNESIVLREELNHPKLA